LPRRCRAGGRTENSSTVERRPHGEEQCHGSCGEKTALSSRWPRGDQRRHRAAPWQPRGHWRSLVEVKLGSGSPCSERICEAQVVYFATYRLNLLLRSKENHARTVPSPGSFSCLQLASHNCLLAWCIALLSSRCVR